jgi:hypothetical protein
MTLLVLAQQHTEAYASFAIAAIAELVEAEHLGLAILGTSSNTHRNARGNSDGHCRSS